jgi:hypothetical protein
MRFVKGLRKKIVEDTTLFFDEKRSYDRFVGCTICSKGKTGL